MTFRQDAPLIVQYGISYGMMVPVDLALVCLVPEYCLLYTSLRTGDKIRRNSRKRLAGI